MNRSRQKNRGFSLVELLVAAAIMGIVVISVVAIVRKGRDIQVTDKHRQEARAILNARFERDFQPNTFASIPVGEQSETVEIDPRDGNPLTGMLYTSVVRNDLNASTIIQRKIVKLKMVWQETEDGPDSLVMVKWVTQ